MVVIMVSALLENFRKVGTLSQNSKEYMESLRNWCVAGHVFKLVHSLCISLSPFVSLTVVFSHKKVILLWRRNNYAVQKASSGPLQKTLISFLL